VITIDDKMTPKQIVDNLRGVDVNENDEGDTAKERHHVTTREVNPGAHLKLNLDPDAGAFRSLFVCSQTSREAFRHCRRVVAMGGTFTKNAVQQCVLIAVTVDADITLFASHGESLREKTRQAGGYQQAGRNNYE